VCRWLGKSDPDFYCVLLLLVCQLNLAGAALASGKNKRHREDDDGFFGETNFAYHWREKDKASRKLAVH
jgi:hypothetical protein